MDEISWVLDPRPPMNTILEYLGYGVSDVVVKRSQDIYSRFFTVLFFGGDSQDYIFLEYSSGKYLGSPRNGSTWKYLEGVFLAV